MNGVVKIADFGLSRTISVPFRAYSANVVTQWYRAPKLLLGIKEYAYSLDIWALGCVFAEMESGQPLFIGDSEIDQVQKIFSILGTPRLDEWPGAVDIPTFKPGCAIGLHKSVLIRGDGFKLLQMMLKYKPNKRISAKQILKHRFLNNHDKTKRYPPLAPSNNNNNSMSFSRLSVQRQVSLSYE